MSFFSVITKVAKIGGQILSKIGELDRLNDHSENKPPNVTFGNVTWVHDPKTGNTQAANFDGGESVISYSTTSSDGVLSTLIQPLPYTKTYDATHDLSEFANGDICILPSSESSETLKNVEFRDLLCYAAIMFIGKIALTKSFSLEKTNTGFKIESSTIFSEVSIDYKDKEGNSFTIKSNPNRNNNNTSVVEIPFPNGSSNELPFNNLSVTIKMPSQAFREMTSENRLRLKKVEEVPLLQSFLATAYLEKLRSL